MNASYTGEQIAQRRKQLGLTQAALAQQLHVTDKAVSKWERGTNFPDLGLLEPLAQALQTTPAVLLGLESATQAEAVSSMAQLHNQQLETAKKEMRWMAWGCLIVAFLLAWVYRWIARSQVHTYQLLLTLIWVLAIGGIVLLFRYGQIRPWGAGDLGCFYLAAGPVVLINLGYLFLDHGFGTVPNLILYLIAAGALQLLFYRIMNGPLAQALPILLFPVYLIWLLARGGTPANLGLCTLMCLAVYLICRRRDKQAKPIPLRKAAVGMLAALLAFCLIFSSTLVQAYVHLFHGQLESYCQEFLDESSGISTRQYGPWRATAYPEDGMVEFSTGGSGLVANSAYEGFYYSEADTHTPFHGADVPLEDWGNTANWTDGTDNHGTSRRLRDHWFWFEAYF